MRPRLAERRRRRRLTLFVLLMILGLCFFGAFAALSHHSRVNIHTIEVSGVQKIPPEEVRAVAARVLDDGLFHLFSQSNIFLYPKKDLDAELRSVFPRIHDISITRDAFFGQTLRIDIGERAAFAIWCSSECFLMDRGGFIFARAEGLTESGYTFGGGLDESRSPIGQTFLYGHFRKSLALLSLLERAGYAPRGLTVESEQDFSVLLIDGFFILATFEEEEEKLVRRLALALSSDALRGKEADIEYVDLRFGNKLFYKMKGEEASGE